MSKNQLLYSSEHDRKDHIKSNESRAKWGDPGNYRGILLLLVLDKSPAPTPLSTLAGKLRDAAKY